MDIDADVLNRFERELIPHDLSKSSIPVKVIGFGEIKVVMDLVANLHKEQRPDLIPVFLRIVNKYLENKLTQKEIDAYYTSDKRIWVLFSALRKADRFVRVNFLRKRYEFILPGAVKR